MRGKGPGAAVRLRWIGASFIGCAVEPESVPMDGMSLTRMARAALLPAVIGMSAAGGARGDDPIPYDDGSTASRRPSTSTPAPSSRVNPASKKWAKTFSIWSFAPPAVKFSLAPNPKASPISFLGSVEFPCDRFPISEISIHSRRQDFRSHRRRQRHWPRHRPAFRVGRLLRPHSRSQLS